MADTHTHSGVPLPQPGDRVADRFQIIRVIGRGGFGMVYEARQESMGHRRVALKVLAPRRAHEPKAAERFRQEALLASRLSHPNTITLFDFGATEQGLWFIAMEYLEGEPLAVVLRREGGLPLARAEHITKQLLGALAEAHSIGLIHRDLKPDNVFLSRVYAQGDLVKVLDFGLAKFMGVLDDGPWEPTLLSQGRTDLTLDGLVCGTPDYMAPEQARGEALSPAADVYAVGLLIYQMLVGDKPFRAKTPRDVLKLQIREPLPKVAPEYEESLLARVMHVAARKRADQRYKTAAGMLEALRGEAPVDPVAPVVHSGGFSAATATVRRPMPTPAITVSADDVHTQTHHSAAFATPPPRSAVDSGWRTPTQSVPAVSGFVLPRALPLVGRETEVGNLLGLVRSAAETGRPRIILVEGPAGVGKSRLLGEVGRLLRETTDVVVGGGYFRTPSAGATDGLATLVGHLLGISPEYAATLARLGSLPDAVDGGLERLRVELDDRDRALLSRVLAPGLAPQPAALRDSPPSIILERLVRLVIRIGAQQPMILVFEDVQLADRASLDFLRRLVAACGRRQLADPLPLTIALTLRDGPSTSPALLRLLQTLQYLEGDRAVEVRIDPLAEGAARDLVAAALEAHPELKERVAAAARGNPLHILQILQHLLDEGRLVQADGRWHLVDADKPLSLPDDLADMLRLRIQHVVASSSAPEAMDALLCRMAVIGRRCPRRLLRMLLSHEERPWPDSLLRKLLAELEAQAVLRSEMVAAGSQTWGEDADSVAEPALLFEQALLPELLLRHVDASPTGGRLHLRAARAKEEYYGDGADTHADEVANHLVHAGEVAEALPRLLEASRRSLALGDHHGALQRLLRIERLIDTHAEPLDADPALRHTVWLGLGTVNLRLGRTAPAEHYLRRILAAGTDAERLTVVRAQLRLGELLYRHKRYRAATEMLSLARAGAEVERRDPEILEARILLGEVALAEQGGVSGSYAAELEQSLDASPDLPPLLRARGLQHLGNVSQAHGDAVAAERYLARARMIAAEVGDPDAQAPICCDLGFALLLQGRIAEGEGMLREAHETYTDLGDRLQLSICLHRLGQAAWRRDAPDDAIEFLDQALAIQRDLDLAGHLSETLTLRGRILEAAGDLSGAHEAYRGATEQTGEHTREFQAELLLRLGTTALKRARLDEARHRLAGAAQGFAAMAETRLQVQALNLLAMATCWSAEIVPAVALLRQSAALAARCGDTPGEVFAQAVLALLGHLHAGSGGGDPLEHLRVARSRHTLGTGGAPPSPLLTSIERILDGGGVESLAPGLTLLQDRWIRSLITD